MLSFDLRELSQGAVQVDGRLDRDDPVWLPDDLRPDEDIRVRGRLSGAGGDRFYFSGRIEGRTKSPCRRCLQETLSDVAEEAHVLFAPPGDEAAGDDPDVYPIDERSGLLDLRPAVRELWLLSAPAFAQCRPECKGLCPSCGADLNEGPCGCEEKVDPRWAALKKAKKGG